MKKMLSALLISLLSAICVFAFTACGNKEEAPYTSVTEEQFNEAVGMFVLDAEDYFEKYGEKLNFTVQMNVKVNKGDKVEETGAICELDYANKKVYVHDNSIADIEIAYDWQNDNGVFSYRLENGEARKSNGYQTLEATITSTLEELTAMFFVGAGVNPYQYLSEMGLTFDGQTGLYTVQREIYGSGINAELGFSGGKLVYLNFTTTEGIGQQTTYYYSDYGTTQFTIPEDILNMPVN